MLSETTYVFVQVTTPLTVSEFIFILKNIFLIRVCGGDNRSYSYYLYLLMIKIYSSTVHKPFVPHKN